MKQNLNGKLYLRLVDVLSRHVEPIFKDGTKSTIIARTPGNNEADVLVTDDSIDELAALLERSRARDDIAPADGAMRNTLIRRDAQVQDRRFAAESSSPTAFGPLDGFGEIVSGGRES